MSQHDGIAGVPDLAALQVNRQTAGAYTACAATEDVSVWVNGGLRSKW
jgi:hypothetical protein